MKTYITPEDKAFFKRIKPERDARVGMISDAVEALCNNLVSLHGTSGHAFAVIAKQLRSYIYGYDAKVYDLARYFKGEGPVASGLKELAEMNQYLNGGMSAVTAFGTTQNFRANQLIEAFSYPLSEDEKEIHALQSFMDHVGKHYTGDTFPWFLSELLTDGYMYFDQVKSGIYEQRGPGYRQACIILRCTLPNTEIDVLGVFGVGGMPVLRYYHPYEDAWLGCDYKCILSGTLKALKKEFSKLLGWIKKELEEPKDWAEKLAELQAKADEVFDQQDFLPPVHGGYKRHSAIESEIRIYYKKYMMIYICTAGDYPSRTFTVGESIGSLLSALPFDALPVEASNYLLRLANYELGNLQDEINTNMAAQEQASEKEGVPA